MRLGRSFGRGANAGFCIAPFSLLRCADCGCANCEHKHQVRSGRIPRPGAPKIAFITAAGTPPHDKLANHGDRHRIRTKQTPMCDGSHGGGGNRGACLQQWGEHPHRHPHHRRGGADKNEAILSGGLFAVAGHAPRWNFAPPDRQRGCLCVARFWLSSSKTSLYSWHGPVRTTLRRRARGSA